MRLGGDQRTTRCQGLAEEDPELFFFVAVVVGMLLPDERVSSDREELVEIGGVEGPELQELPPQNGLQIKVATHSFASSFLSKAICPA